MNIPALLSALQSQQCAVAKEPSGDIRRACLGDVMAALGATQDYAAQNVPYRAERVGDTVLMLTPHRVHRLSLTEAQRLYLELGDCLLPLTKL